MLDTRTVAVMVVLMIVTTSLVHLVNWRLHPQIRGSQWWFAGSLTQVAGVVLLLLRGRISDALSIVLANVLLAVGLMMMTHGTFRFAGLQPRRWLHPLAAGALLAGLVVFTYLQPSLLGRWWTFGLCTAVVLSASLQAQRHIARSEGWLGVGGYSAASLGVIGVMLGIPTALSIHQPQMERLFEDSVVISWGFALFAVLLTMQSFGRVLMTANRIQQELQRMALLDGLTGLPNRRAFDDALHRAASAAQRAQVPLGLLLLDIDHFKRINDVHGHLAGDHVLKEVARLVQARIRRDEVFARYGGEEFCLVLPETPLEGAVEAGERLRQQIAEHIFTFQDDRIKVTMSVGCALLGESDKTATELIQRADERLYQAKNSGRNRVCA